MTVRFRKYHGAGNDFLIADNRDGSLALTVGQVRHLCDRHTGFGADGLMLLEECPEKDFRMVFYNPDGSSGMMCGNGGRCIVAFAADLGVISPGDRVLFSASDGDHSAEISPADEGGSRTVRLKMKDVSGIESFPDEHSWFLDTGTRHLVKFVSGLKDYPVLAVGPVLRHDPRFAPVGTNVNFVEPETVQDGTVLHIRTFEKGVEYETLACGTGIVASAMAAWNDGLPPVSREGDSVRYLLKAAIADLGVDFIPECSNGVFGASEVWLTGPAQFIGFVEADFGIL